MKSKNLKIKRLPFSRMLKSEVADYAEKAMEIYESEEHKSVLVSPLYNQLLSKKGDIKLLRLSYGIDTERLREYKLRAELMLHISAFKLRVKMLTRSNLELDLHVIQNAINTHLRYLNKCKNDKALSQKIAGFLDLVVTNFDLQAALNEFDLNNEVTSINVAYSDLTEASHNRVRLLSKRPQIDTKEITKGMATAIDNLFKAIEVAALVSTVDEDGVEVDVTQVMDEMNQLSEMYYKSITIRDANNKRKALEEEMRMQGKVYVHDWTDESETSADDDTALCNTDQENDDEQEETSEID